MITVYLIIPKSKECRTWLFDNLILGEAQFWGKGIVVEHRYIEAIIKAMRIEGFKDGIDFEVMF